MSKAKTYSSNILDEIFQEIKPEEAEKIEKRMLLAARIDDALNVKGWKKKDLAEALNKRPSEISKWLSGNHNFTTDTLWDIERVLQIELIPLEDRPKEQVITYNFVIKQSVEASKVPSYADLIAKPLLSNLFQGGKSLGSGKSSNKYNYETQV